MMYRIDESLTLQFSSRWGVLQDSTHIGQPDIVINRLPYISTEDGDHELIPKYHIPVTSLKGTLRYAAQRITKDTCTGTNVICNAKNLCLACSVFGTKGKNGKPFRPAKIHLNSIYIDPETIPTQESVQISINRKTKTTQEGALFFTEVLPPMHINTRIRGTHLTEEEVIFLKSALRLWQDVGLGRKHTTFTIANINEIEFSPMEENL